MKKLYRSKNQRMISGVCGGLAQYFNCDATLIRLLWAIVSLFMAGFPGVILYLICAVIIPDEPDAYDTTGYYHND